MDVSGKIWGKTSKIFGNSTVEVHRIEGKLGGKSSMHKHASKFSLFYVEKGKIAVTIEKYYGPNQDVQLDITVLTAGQSTRIKPNEYHGFEILEEGTVAYEIYWVEIDPEDIERRNKGTITSHSRT